MTDTARRHPAPTPPDPAGLGGRAPRPPRGRGRGRWIVTAIALLLAITVVSTAPIWQRILRDGAGQEPVAGATAIRLVDDWFTPSVVEVPAGTTVRFTWADGDTPHDIAFADGVTTPVQAVGTFERTFDAPGDVTFRCTLHPGMTGRVVVTD